MLFVVHIGQNRCSHDEAQIIAVKTVIIKFDFLLRIATKDAGRIASSVDPDQTAAHAWLTQC